MSKYDKKITKASQRGRREAEGRQERQKRGKRESEERQEGQERGFMKSIRQSRRGSKGLMKYSGFHVNSKPQARKYGERERERERKR